MNELWTLFVVVSGLAQPIEIDGYPDKDACRAAGTAMVKDFTAPITTEPFKGSRPVFAATFSCTQLPEPPLSCD